MKVTETEKEVGREGIRESCPDLDERRTALDSTRQLRHARTFALPLTHRKLLNHVLVLSCILEVTNVWQAREVGELRKRGRLVEIRRWRKHARRRKNAKPSFLDEQLIKTRRLHQVTQRDAN